MDTAFRDQFLQLWRRYFNGAEIPITYFYSTAPAGQLLEAPEPTRCLFADLVRVRAGCALCLNAGSFACADGRHAFGFPTGPRPHYEHILSCGIPGEVEGKRFKQTPELVRAALRDLPRVRAARGYLIFKRWDRLTEKDEPQVVVFFVGPDELSGLFWLAHFDESVPDAVLTPFAAGCMALGAHPLAQCRSRTPRAVLGLLDPAARACLPDSMLTLAVPMTKFERMVATMEESFLSTPAWGRVRARIESQGHEDAV